MGNHRADGLAPRHRHHMVLGLLPDHFEQGAFRQGVGIFQYGTRHLDLVVHGETLRRLAEGRGRAGHQAGNLAAHLD
jgi:hypothetical protein